MTRAALFALALGAAAAAASMAVAAQPSLFVVPVVFLPKGEAADPAGARDLSDPAGAAYFAQRFKAAFPGATETIDDASSRRTFVVSLQVSRMSVYQIPKVNGNVERQLALTGSLYFTNVRTGEVLFTYTATSYLDKTVRPVAGVQDGGELYGAAFRDLVDDLIAKSSAAFKPYEVAATSKRSVGSLVVLDHGYGSGLGVGDSLSAPDGAQARTIFVEPNYAVAEVQLGNPQAATVWSKFSTRSLGDVRKADAIVDLAPGGNRSGLSDEEVRQLFSDALGEKTPLSVLPVNPDFAEVVNYVRQKTQLSREATAIRRLPAYFVRLTVPAPRLYEAPTNVAYKTLRTTHVRVYAELVDRSGRVQFAGAGEDTIKDEVTEGMGYSPEARVEVAVKNALVDLVGKMAGQLTLEQVDSPVTSAESAQFAAADPKGVLKVSANLTVLHSLGRLDGGDQVWAPSWTAHVTETAAGLARANGDLALFSGAPAIRSGDVARLEHVGAEIRGATVRPCALSEALGGRKVAGLEPLALNLFAGSGRATTYLSDFVASEAKRLRDTGDFEDKSVTPAEPPALCVEPVNKIDVLKEDCDPRGLCRSDVAVAVGYRLRRGEEIVRKAALQTTVHSSAYFKSIPPAARDALVDDDIEAAAAPLFKSLTEQGQLN